MPRRPSRRFRISPRFVLVGSAALLGLLFALARRGAPGLLPGPSPTSKPSAGAQSIVSTSAKTLHPDLRAKLARVFSRLEGRGFQPTFGTTWRNTAWQADAKAKGRSRLSFSLHNVVHPTSGNPAALAGDVVDRRYGWGEKVGSPPSSTNPLTIGAAGFFRALGEEVHREGLGWGGDYGRSNPLWAGFGLGWDPAHVTISPTAEHQWLATLEKGGWPSGLAPA